MPLLEVKNLHVTVDGKSILKGLDLTVEKGEVHAIMGPNGSGKSTLAYVMAGKPGYEATEGQILLDGENVLAHTAHLYQPGTRRPYGVLEWPAMLRLLDAEQKNSAYPPYWH